MIKINCSQQTVASLSSCRSSVTWNTFKLHCKSVLCVWPLLHYKEPADPQVFFSILVTAQSYATHPCLIVCLPRRRVDSSAAAANECSSSTTTPCQENWKAASGNGTDWMYACLRAGSGENVNEFKVGSPFIISATSPDCFLSRLQWALGISFSPELSGGKWCRNVTSKQRLSNNYIQ